MCVAHKLKENELVDFEQNFQHFNVDFEQNLQHFNVDFEQNLQHFN